MNKPLQIGSPISGTVEKIKKDRVTVLRVDGQRYVLDMKTEKRKANETDKVQR